MELTARVIQHLPMQSGVSKSGNQWSKATVIVEMGFDTQYPKKVALINMNKAEELSQLPIGGVYDFKIDVESREYQGKWYSDIRTYAWSVQGQQAPPPQQQYAQPQSQPPMPQGGYSPTPQLSGYQQPQQGFTQGSIQPPQQQSDEDLPF